MMCEGSFTVEASMVISIALCLLGFVILTGYDLFYDTVGLVTEDVTVVEYVSLFKKIDVVQEIWNSIK